MLRIFFSGLLLPSVCFLAAAPHTGASEGRYFRTYYPNGALKAELSYHEGRLEGDARWYYESGALGALLNYRNSRLHGTTKIFYENGNVKRVMSLQDNYPVGKSEFFSREGTLLWVDFHRQGQVKVRWHYHPEGYVSRCEELPTGPSGVLL